MGASLIETPDVRLPLRDYQTDALDRVAEAEARGVRRQLGVAATGLGKTVMFCTLAHRRGGRTLILAHRDELVTQAVAKVLEVWPGLGATDAAYLAVAASEHRHVLDGVELRSSGVGIVKGTADDTRATVVVASVQTLSRSTRLDRLRLAWGDPFVRSAPPFGLVVVDEAHHAAAKSYRKILDALDGYPLVLGVTATPDRGDGRGLDDLFDEITFSYDLLFGIRAGYLSDLRGLAVKVDGLDLADVRVNRGDYDQGQAGALMQRAHAEAWIVRAWQAHAADRKTLVFTPTVAMAEAVADAFTDAGVAAAAVSGSTPIDERRQILAKFRRGDLQVVANCAVLTEGYDEPSVDCVIVARPTRSRALYTQMIGRGTRRYPDKADCLILDVVGASEDHSLVTIPSLFGITKAGRLRDGTTTLTHAVELHEQEEIAAGRLRADEVEMFHRVRAEGIAWVQVHLDGDDLRRYIRPIGGKDDPTVVLAQRETGEDVWTAGLQFPDGTKRALIVKVPLELAQGVGEDCVRKLSVGRAALVDRDAQWRAKRPTAKQRKAAKAWHLPVDPKWTAGDLSDALTAHITRVRSKSG